MRFDNLRMQRLGRPTALAAAAFSILMMAFLDHVLLAGGPLLCGILPRVVGWLTLGSDCFISRSSDFLSLALECCV